MPRIPGRPKQTSPLVPTLRQMETIRCRQWKTLPWRQVLWLREESTAAAEPDGSYRYVQVAYVYNVPEWDIMCKMHAHVKFNSFNSIYIWNMHAYCRSQKTLKSQLGHAANSYYPWEYFGATSCECRRFRLHNDKGSYYNITRHVNWYPLLFIYHWDEGRTLYIYILLKRYTN